MKRHCRLWILLLFSWLGSSPVVALASGSYLVDDATVIPDGHCQIEAWGRWLPRGSFDVTAVPACSIHDIEVSATLVGRGGPQSSQSEGLALKHVVGDFDKSGFAYGIAANGLLTNGRVVLANVYVPLSIKLSDDNRWTLNVDAGFQRVENPAWHALLGAGMEMEIAEHWRFIGEYLRNGSKVTTIQAGLRVNLAKDVEMDLVTGQTHDVGTEQWLTVGLNFVF